MKNVSYDFGGKSENDTKRELRLMQERFDAALTKIKEKISKERNISKKLEELLVSEVNKTSRMD